MTLPLGGVRVLDLPDVLAGRICGCISPRQEIALAETAVAVLGKRRMIGDVAVEPQATEPAIGQIEVDLVAQPPL